jgi:hypothetical protein
MQSNASMQWKQSLELFATWDCKIIATPFVATPMADEMWLNVTEWSWPWARHGSTMAIRRCLKQMTGLSAPSPRAAHAVQTRFRSSWCATTNLWRSRTRLALLVHCWVKTFSPCNYTGRWTAFWGPFEGITHEWDRRLEACWKFEPTDIYRCGKSKTEAGR